MDQLSQIYKEIENDSRFDHLRKPGINIVPGSGNVITPPLMFIGEAPGAQENRRREPFVGAAGRVLDNLLGDIGIRREDVYITNVLKYRPPANRDPVADERIAMFTYLMREMSAVNPRFTVLLGRHALNTFFPKARISEVHGELFHDHYIPLYHPAVVVYDPTKKNMLIHDFHKILNYLEISRSWPDGHSPSK